MDDKHVWAYCSLFFPRQPGHGRSRIVALTAISLDLNTSWKWHTYIYGKTNNLLYYCVFVLVCVSVCVRGCLCVVVFNIRCSNIECIPMVFSVRKFLLNNTSIHADAIVICLNGSTTVALRKEVLKSYTPPLKEKRLPHNICSTPHQIQIFLTCAPGAIVLTSLVFPLSCHL